MEPLEPGDPVSAGRYRVLYRLGQKTYLGISDDQRAVVIKVIPGENDEEFRTEAEAAGQVWSDFVAPVVDAGADDSPPWLATALVPPASDVFALGSLLVFATTDCVLANAASNSSEYCCPLIDQFFGPHLTKWHYEPNFPPTGKSIETRGTWPRAWRHSGFLPGARPPPRISGVT